MTGTKNLLLSIVAVLALAMLVVYASTTIKQDLSVIRMAHDSKEQSPLHLAMLKFKSDVELRTNGELTVMIYPARQLGGVKETTELVQQGNLEMTVGASVLLTSIVPEFSVLDLFYLFRDTSHAHAALDHDEIGLPLLASMKSKGFYGLGFMEVGFRNLSSSRWPIKELKDLQGLKIRAASNPSQIAAWSSVGTLPTPLSWGEIFTSLQQGLIDSQESAVYSIFAERFYEAQTYLSITEHTYTSYVWFSNNEFWSSLPSSQRELLEELADAAIVYQRKLAEKQNASIVDELVSQGMQVNVVNQVTRQQMANKMNDVIYKDLRLKTGADLFDSTVAKIKAL